MHLEIAVKNAVVQEIRNLEICSFELVISPPEKFQGKFVHCLSVRV